MNTSKVTATTLDLHSKPNYIPCPDALPWCLEHLREEGETDSHFSDRIYLVKGTQEKLSVDMVWTPAHKPDIDYFVNAGGNPLTLDEMVTAAERLLEFVAARRAAPGTK